MPTAPTTAARPHVTPPPAQPLVVHTPSTGEFVQPSGALARVAGGLSRRAGWLWRGVTRWQPIFDGATMILVGCLATGQAVIYPIRDNIDDQGRQLVNWVFEMES